MTHKKIGFIGMGNMATAMISGLIQQRSLLAEQIWGYNIHPQKAEQARIKWGIHVAQSAAQLIDNVDIVVLAVKPKQMLFVVAEIRQSIKPETIIISVAAGVTIEKISQQLVNPAKIVRMMPNTPVMVNEGMISCSFNEQLTPDEIKCIMTIFTAIGRIECVPESLIHAVVGVSGSSPAYAYLFIEALADGAVQAGMSREQAYTFAAQAVMGAAKMVLETQQHPAQLKDAVCSPAGTTIEAVKALEINGFRAAVLKAVDASVCRSKMMSGER